MKKLIAKLQQLGITYTEIAAAAGQSPENVRQYFSGRRLRLIEWAPEAVEKLLILRGCSAEETQELIAGWQADRDRLMKGLPVLDDSGDQQAPDLDTEIRNTVRTAWGWPAAAAHGLEAMQQSLIAGAEIDEEAIRRTAEIQTRNVLVEGVIQGMTARLWAEREAEKRGVEREVMAADADYKEQIAALERRLAGAIIETAEDAVMNQALSVKLQSLKNLQKDAWEPWGALAIARAALKEFTDGLVPLHPKGRQPAVIAGSMEEAVAVLLRPWEVADPAAVIALFHLRGELGRIADVERDLWGRLVAAGINPGLPFKLQVVQVGTAVRLEASQRLDRHKPQAHGVLYQVTRPALPPLVRQVAPPPVQFVGPSLEKMTVQQKAAIAIENGAELPPQ